MNKLIISVTNEENNNFSRHLNMAVGFGKKMVAEKTIPENNPIHSMLSKLSYDLSQSHNGLLEMIVLQDLVSRIEEYQQVDSDPLVQFAKIQVNKRVGDHEEAKKYLIRTRQLLSALKLQKTQPSYSNAWIGEVQTQDRIDFMIRNAAYPVDENAMKDYIAFFIYQLVLAPQIA